MSYVTILWSAAAAAALLFGGVHGLVWLYDRRARANLAFAVAALGLAAGAITELGMLNARTPAEYGEWMWWTHIPLFVFVTSMALFLRLYLNAGRWWLLGALIAARGVILVLNFASEPNFNFQSIDAIDRLPFLGEQVTVVTRAVTGEHQWFALLAALLFPLFTIDVVITLWRRGTAEARRMALVVGGPFLLSLGLSALLTQLVIWRVVQLPMLLIPPFLISLAAMALEVSRDVLRASRLARRLRESEERLRLAASAAGAGLWGWDAESNRLWATDRARMVLGLDATGDITPVDVLHAIDPNDVPAFRAALREAMQRGGEHAVQFRVAAPKGSRSRWIAAQGTVELGTGSRAVLMRGVVRDVTQQRQTEEDLHELRRKLAHTGRVTMLGQLSSALAHELSQPLAAIQYNAETAQKLLADDVVDMKELRAIVGDILRDDRRAAEVVQRLRTWLKQGRMQMESISLAELAQDVLHLVRPDAAARHVVIECAVPRALPPVLGDRIHLSQVLLNLVMNAMDALAEVRDAQRRVLIEGGVGADGCCEVSVSDTGPGIAADKLNTIFEPFFTAKTDGMGVGLSISRAIVEAHGGKLWAENGARGGATFRFTVPRRNVEVGVYA